MKLILVKFISAAFLTTLVVSSDIKKEIINGCIEQGDCMSGPVNCTTKCGCDSAYYYNSATDKCVLDVRAIMNKKVQKYNNNDELNVEAGKAFQGIFVSALMIVTCSCICVLSACYYCCRITYYDHKLHNDVMALAEKIRMGKIRKICTKVKTEPIAESCNVVVKEAGVFVC